MQRTNNIIELVGLASKDYQESIVSILRTLDGTLSFINTKCWLEGQIRDLNSLIVLVLPENDLMVDKIIKAISASPNSYYFIVFSSPLTDEIRPILNACSDYCCWPCDPLELAFRLERFSSKHNNSFNLKKFDMETAGWRNLNLIGQSSIFLDTLSFIKKASDCNAPVLIEGETGCGKEVAARAIHYLGCRKDFPFIPMNCGAIPDQLIENELFGHEKGAYTDAKQSQAGLTEQADGGTLFLDEIEALSTKGQVTLLRFIEDNVIKPLGAIKSRKVNVRIIAASNVCLSELVAQGLFRQDLLFRLNLLHLNLPPLRCRKTDIQPLAEHFMQKYRSQYQQPDKRVHPDTLAWMNDYHWPGNVRELENFVHRSFLLSEDPEIIQTNSNHEDVQSCLRRKLFERRQNFKFDVPFSEAKNHVINQFEQRYLTWLITSSNGNVTQAADMAQKERRALGKLLKKHDINPDQYRGN
ncbi:MAG: sigma-54 dependent transcriptional regulator [Methylobacter sp.]|uniref:sigma 54-interacting transcriptional regulator n=1 Tax=Methylobacter sp. TaxID=2051955 RepID=UPI0025F6E7AB|nr:sigma-54 dependent transcriptional regulator [Methylobacter sp.]MCK9623091.1 sigma-54 dependent transcriptional regulator [Methylobacter sp.]